MGNPNMHVHYQEIIAVQCLRGLSVLAISQLLDSCKNFPTYGMVLAYMTPQLLCIGNGSHTPVEVQLACECVLVARAKFGISKEWRCNADLRGV